MTRTDDPAEEFVGEVAEVTLGAPVETFHGRLVASGRWLRFELDGGRLYVVPARRLRGLATADPAIAAKMFGAES